jgi:hypothetical protein
LSAASSASQLLAQARLNEADGVVSAITNGIVVLATIATALILIFSANVNSLILSKLLDAPASGALVVPPTQVVNGREDIGVPSRSDPLGIRETAGVRTRA